jgi:hypothetical protein
VTRFIGVANIALHAFCPVDIATPAIEKKKRNISNTEKKRLNIAYNMNLKVSTGCQQRIYPHIFFKIIAPPMVLQ